MSDKTSSEEKIITLSQEEINALNEVQQRNQILQAEYRDLGQLRVSLALREEKAKDFLVRLSELERETAQALQTKYGEGTLDLEKGVFIKNA